MKITKSLLFNGSVNSILELPTGQIIARQMVSSNTVGASRSSVNINLYDGLEWDAPDFFRDNDITTVSNMPEYVVVSGG